MRAFQNWHHDKLAEDLALAIETPFLNIPLGSVWAGQATSSKERQTAIASAETPEDIVAAVEMSGAGTQLADVVVVKPSFTRFCLTIYEVKVSRADFQADVRTGKYKGYIGHCHRMYFATPAEMVTKDEIPEDAGWIVRGESGWKIMKRAPSRHVEIPEATMMSLIFKKQHLTVRERRANSLLKPSKDRVKALKALGRDLADAWSAREKYRQLADDYEGRLDLLRRAVREGLGIDQDTSRMEMVTLNGLVRQIKQKAALMGIEPMSTAIPRSITKSQAP